MKKLAVLAAVALSAAFIPLKAPAKDMILNVSGTIKYQGQDTGSKGTIGSFSFNEKTIYFIITNALAGGALVGTNNVSTLGTNIAPATMPANGYIAFNPYNPNADGSIGTFYVTNKTGFSFPLSGLDANGQYYSFIELDTFVYIGAGNGFDIGYGDLFSGLSTYSITSGTGTSIGVLYVHDNPYAYDDADDPDALVGGYFGGNFTFSGPQNMDAIEIRGIVTAPFKFPGGNPTLSSISVTGNGNCVVGGGAFFNLVSSGHAAFAQ